MLLDAKHDPNTSSIAAPTDDDQRTSSSATLAPPCFDQANNQISRSTKHHVLVVVLHGLLVLVHVILLVAWSRGLVDHFVVSPGKSSSRLLLILTLFSQIIAVVYTASLVTLTQKVALRRNLHIPQPLSAIHDKFSAWSSVGSAFTTLFCQGEVPTGILGIALITTYLTGICLILITTPALFTLLPTVTSAPVSLAVQWLDMSQKNLGDIDTRNSVGILSSLAILTKSSEQPGLSGNVFYGVVAADQQGVPNFDQQLLSNPIVTDSTVDATTFHISCGLLNNSTQVNSRDVATGKVWDISTALQNTTISTTNAGVLRIAPCSYNTTNGTYSSSNILIYGNVSVTDSNGLHSSSIELDPPVRVPPNEDGIAQWSTLSVIGCSLDTSDGHVKVNGQTSLLVKGSNKSKKNGSNKDNNNGNDKKKKHHNNKRDSHGHQKDGNNDDSGDHWKPWKTALFDPDIGDSWIQVMNTPERSSVPVSDCFQYGISPPSQTSSRPCEPTDLLSIVELYLNQQLNLNIPGNRTHGFSAKLSDLEEALGNATAAVYWAGHQQDLVTGQQQTDILLTQLQLSINFVPLIIGFLASVLLLGLSILFVRAPRSSTPQFRSARNSTPITPLPLDKRNRLDSLGLLQIFWLFGKYDYQNNISERIAEVDHPSSGNLRQAGLFHVQMDGLRMRGEKTVDNWT